MRTIVIACRRVLPLGGVLLLSLHLGAARAQEVDVRQACTPDAMRLCKDFIPDEGRVKSCMMAKRRELSMECRTAIAGQGRHGRHYERGRREHYYHHHHHR